MVKLNEATISIALQLLLANGYRKVSPGLWGGEESDTTRYEWLRFNPQTGVWTRQAKELAGWDTEETQATIGDTDALIEWLE